MDSSESVGGAEVQDAVLGRKDARGSKHVGSQRRVGIGREGGKVARVWWQQHRNSPYPMLGKTQVRQEARGREARSKRSRKVPRQQGALAANGGISRAKLAGWGWRTHQPHDADSCEDHNQRNAGAK